MTHFGLAKVVLRSLGSNLIFGCLIVGKAMQVLSSPCYFASRAIRLANDIFYDLLSSRLSKIGCIEMPISFALALLTLSLLTKIPKLNPSLGGNEDLITRLSQRNLVKTSAF